MAPKDVTGHPLIARLQQAIGAEHVLTGEDDRTFYGHDVYRQLAIPLAVIRPGTVEELARAVGMITSEGIAVVPRGGGASYSDGYLPSKDDSISIDMSRLNRIMVNARDMYVIAEGGVTWSQLHEELATYGLRTPFWGPFSGLRATVGGAMSQGALSFGSGLFGPSADSVLAMEVVLADGTLARTGAWAAANGTPFFRHYGPDLSALFTGDTGAMGVKVRIALRLMKQLPARMTVSFGFEDFAGLAAGLEAAAKEGVASENFGLNPHLQKAWLRRYKMKQSLQAAFAVFRTARNPLDGTIKLIRMAIAGQRFLAKAEYSAHFIVEGKDGAHTRSLLAALRRAVAPYGNEMPNTIPTVMRATPFMMLNSLIGPAGERWVPVHGIMPFSKAEEFHAKLMDLYARNAARMEALKVHTAAMYLTVSTHAFLYEPVFYWQDSRHVFHTRYLDKAYLDTLPVYPENLEGRKLVEELREAIRRLFAEVGAIHLQAGKSYPYMTGRDAGAASLLKSVKTAVDPKELMNPGSLKL